MKKNFMPSYLNHRKRLKEKYLKGNLNNWLDYEVLELILSYAIPRKDTKPIAKKLLNNFKNFNGVLNADIRDLVKIKGIAEHSAILISLLRDVSKLYVKNNLFGKNILANPQEVVNYLKAELCGSFDEKFKVLFLDSKNHLINTETVHEGIVNKAVVYPRKIVERALANHAVNIIISHNHPSGEVEPSQNDIEVTKTIKKALDTVEIRLLDHIIIGKDKYFSFEEKQMISAGS